MKHISFVAGDPSGDVHAAHLVRALLSQNDNLRFSGLGGPRMQEAGVELLSDLTKASAIGPSDALKHIGTLREAKKAFEEHLVATKPDLVILVDFGDFNLPFIAPMVKQHGIQLAYFISPQLWAWGRWRLRYVKQYVDHMIVLLPFEQEFYAKAGVQATWVGHPIIEETQATRSAEETAEILGLSPMRMTVGLLPGSRHSEVRRLLPAFIQAAEALSKHMPGLQFVLSQSPNLDDALFTAADTTHCKIIKTKEPLANILQTLDATFVASGTATLQTALHQVPMVVAYKTTWPTFLFARMLLKIPDIALVNVIAGKRLVPELLQNQVAPKKLCKALLPLLRDTALITETRLGLAKVKERLGKPGAIDRAATTVLDIIEEAGRS